MNEDIHTRIYNILQQKGISAAQFADAIGIQRSSMSHLLAGRNKPSIDFLQKCIHVYPDIDILWLISGKTSTNGVQESENNAQLRLSVVKSNKNLEQASLFDSPPAVYSSNQAQRVSSKKTIERIVTFYSDKTFTEYIPE